MAETNSRWPLIVACAGTAVALLEVTVVYLALPAIGEDLQATFGEQQWVIDAYALAVAAGLLPIGTLADRVGRRRVFLAGLAMFAVASSICAAAPTALALDLARALQGIGAAAILSTSLALIAAAYDGRARARAMGVWGAVSGVALAAGPILGGVLLETAGWEWIFVINIPLAGAIALAALRVSETRDPAAPPPDVLGAGLFSAALAVLVAALLRGQSEGWGSAQIVAAMSLAAVLLAAFVAVELRSAAPMLDPRLFRDRSFSATAAVAFLQSVAIYPVLLFMVVDLQAVYGLGALEAGVRVLPITLVLAAVAPIAGRLTGRASHRVLLSLGLSIVAGGLLLMRGADPAGTWIELLPGFLALGFGLGVLSPGMAAAMMDALPSHRAGLASGVGNTFRQAGIAAGVAVLGSVFVAAVPGGADPDALLRSLELSGPGAEAFAEGLDAVLVAGAAFAVAGAAAALAITGRRPVGPGMRRSPGHRPPRGGRFGFQPHPQGEAAVPSTVPDSDLKARHRKMWASGDYPAMVETFLLPLGPRLVEACAIGDGMSVLDVAAGTGNASIPAAERGARVTASDLTPELLAAGRVRAESKGLELEWVEADAENLPFEDAAFDVVMSSIGAMFAPHHQEVADELVRVCRPGGTIGMLNWTPEGMIGALFRTMGPFAPPPPPGAQPAPLWGSEEHVREVFADRVEWRTLARDMLEITAFERPRDYGEHFKALYGPTITARANASKTGREAEFDEALDAFCDEWNRGNAEQARFEQEYLLAVGTRTQP